MDAPIELLERLNDRRSDLSYDGLGATDLISLGLRRDVVEIRNPLTRALLLGHAVPSLLQALLAQGGGVFHSL